MPGPLPPPDFGPLRRKLARAKERQDDLRSAVDVYLATDPCRIEELVNGTTYSLHSWIDQDPDPEWAVDISEIANSARSVLDQLVWQLVLATGNDPAPLHTQFPIAADFSAYAQGKRPPRERMLAGVARRHRKVIDEAQPYQGGRQAGQHPLFVLNKIVNNEKHRAGHAVLGTATECVALLTKPGDDDVTIRFKRAMPLGNDVDLLRVDNAPDPATPHLHTKLSLVGFNIDVGFSTGHDVYLLTDIERALVTVSQVVDRCEARL